MVGDRKTKLRGASEDVARTRTCKCTVPEIEDIVPGNGALPMFSKEEAALIKSSLLSWYDQHHRILPWRENLFSKVSTPASGESGSIQVPGEARAYNVWVSEMMLQQTRVATVVLYYQRWMERWPTLHQLAEASQEEVNTLWAGLGYYRRARFLLEGAKHIMANHGGTFPSSVAELQKIPGIGNYTAGAIASIAFKQPVPVVDGNVVRVLCRLRAISANPKASSSVKHFWVLAEQLVDAARPGDLNQSLMELGATTCSPTSPSCAVCPVASQCQALARASQGSGAYSITDFPAKVAKAVPRNEYVAVCVVEKIPGESSQGKSESSFLLVQRPQQGLLAGLWEFPSAKLENSEEKSSSVRMDRVDEYLEKTLGLVIGGDGYKVSARKEIGENTHIFSHIRLYMSIEWLLLEEAYHQPETTGLDGSSLKWVYGSKVQGSGLTSGVKKVFEMFLEFRQAHRNGTCPSSKRTKSKCNTSD